MSKAICEMTLAELMDEYSFCIIRSQNDSLDADIRNYYRDRANVIEKYIQETL